MCDGDVDSALTAGWSLGCDACLDWFHGRFVGISTAPKKIRLGFVMGAMLCMFVNREHCSAQHYRLERRNGKK